MLSVEESFDLLKVFQVAGAMDAAAEDEVKEQQHFQEVVTTFLDYEAHGLAWIRKRKADYEQLSDNHKKRLPTLAKKFSEMKRCLSCNVAFLQEVASPHILFENKEMDFPQQQQQQLPASQTIHGNEPTGSIERNMKGPGTENKACTSTRCSQVHVISSSESDLQKLRSTMRQLYRDWSQEGAQEREMSYGVLLQELVSLFPLQSHQQRKRIRVLCPGAGLARLPWEIAKLGFTGTHSFLF